MPIELMKGDLFATEGLTTYAHGVDCAGEMAAGIAGQFKKRWPAMYEEYRVLCAAGRLHLGDVFPWIGDDVTIYNLAIQRHWRETAKGAALAASLRKMVALASAAGITRVGLPRIAAGLGGLGWTRVRHVLDEVAEETPITLVVFEQFVRSKAAPIGLNALVTASRRPTRHGDCKVVEHHARHSPLPCIRRCSAAPLSARSAGA